MPFSAQGPVQLECDSTGMEVQPEEVPIEPALAKGLAWQQPVRACCTCVKAGQSLQLCLQASQAVGAGRCAMRCRGREGQPQQTFPFLNPLITGLTPINRKILVNQVAMVVSRHYAPAMMGTNREFTLGSLVLR